MASVTINIAKTHADVEAVKQIFLEYLGFIQSTLGEDLCFQDTKSEFARFPEKYELLFLAKLDSVPVGACGLKKFSKTECELKRLFCRPAGRGYGLGRKLTIACINEGRAQGYRRVLLDTNRDLKAANAIYEELGFKDVGKYYENPLICSRYMALDLVRVDPSRAAAYGL